MNKNIIFIVLAIAVVAIGASFFFGTQKNIIPTSTQVSDTTENWKTYTSAKYGYTMKYPSTLTPVEAPEDAIYLHHVEFQVPKVTSISGITVEVRNFTTLEDEIVYRKWTVEGHLIPGKIDSEEPITVSGLPGRVLNYTSGEEKFSIAVVPYQGFVYSIKAPSNQLELYNRIISSFKFLDISNEQRVVDLVKNLPDVKNWLAIFTGPGGTASKSGGKPMFRIEEQNGEIYTVRAYEDVPSPEAHTATFNVFEVNVKTGKISKQF